MSASRTGLEIAIIGMAGRFPGAPDVDAFWRNLRDGVESLAVLSDEDLVASGVERSTLEHPDYVRSRGILEDADVFDAAFFGYYPRDAQILDPQQRVFLECAWEALENGSYDPVEFDGAIGVFAGASANGYRGLLTRNTELLAAVDAFQLALATDRDYLATRVSYKLGLTGPSYTVQTACSTSLVAIHVACESLITGECDMALAGGVSITIPQRVGYLATTGGVLSADGHCRAFDARAQGTVGGDGAGIVVLRRLEDALADGDTIRAVIKGSAVNNDGRQKVGFAAPSVDGQARAVEAAHVAAEVDPATIGYVEAHGTGTPLGDPIEVAALTQAFRARTDERGYCAIGSVKTNVGHLDAAAGVAGLIKTVLALERGELPPSLHFTRPNPQIALDGSPFYVNAQLRPWGHQHGPRRAGVSSFGVGGTNAHAVLEEAPARPGSDPSRAPQLLVLSANTPSALARTREGLSSHLGRDPTGELADIAYTLQVGRQAFAHRAAFLCASHAEAAAALAGKAPKQEIPATPYLPDRPVVFTFPGSGAQHPGMARDVYRDEPVFRTELDRCADLLAPDLGVDLRTVLFAPGGDPSAADVNSNVVFPAAIFSVEYALGRLWMHWGVEPEALIGHSLGEYAAACLAGVFSLEDALALVALRGRLFDRLPQGAMLSVALPAEALELELGPNLDLAAVNAPLLSVAAGPVDAVTELEARMRARGVESRRLPNLRVAMHSAAVDAVAPELRRFLASRRLRPPQRPVISNLTGTWLTPEQATDPAYWAAHLRQTVRFSDGVAELARQPARAFLEVGPGWALSSLVRANGGRRGAPLCLPSLPHARDERSDYVFLLATLGRLWLAGATVNWPGLYTGQRRYRLPLLSKPFERQRYWIDDEQLAPEYALPRNRESTGQRGVVGQASEPGGSTVPTAAPEGEIEAGLVEIWQRVFGIEPIAPNADFFELGGHSLMATRMLGQIGERFAVKLSLQDLVRCPTVEQLAATVNGARGEAAAQAAPAEPSSCASRPPPGELSAASSPLGASRSPNGLGACPIHGEERSG